MDRRLTSWLLFFGLSLNHDIIQSGQTSFELVFEKKSTSIMRSKADKQKKLAGGPCSRGAEKKRSLDLSILTQRRSNSFCEIGFAETSRIYPVNYFIVSFHSSCGFRVYQTPHILAKAFECRPRVCPTQLNNRHGIIRQR